MKKTIFIGLGVLAVAGVGYFFFKNKKKPQTNLGSVDVSTPQTTTTGTVATSSNQNNLINPETPIIKSGTVITKTTVATSVVEQQNLDKAKDLAQKIKDYYTKIAYYKTKQTMTTSTFMAYTSINNYSLLIKSAESSIAKLKDELLNIGYKFEGTSNGILVKL